MIARFALTLALAALLLASMPGAATAQAGDRESSEQAGGAETDAQGSGADTNAQARGADTNVQARGADTNAQAQPALEPTSDDSGWALSADFQVPLTRSLADAVNRGVPLYFVLEFELHRPRWWWTDELVAERSITWRLAYHALTQRYRLTHDGVIQPFDSLDVALRALGRVRSWRVVDAFQVSPGVAYEAQVRLRLDSSQLPKPFQISGLTNRDWNPQAEWIRFTFIPPIPKSAQ